MDLGIDEFAADLDEAFARELRRIRMTRRKYLRLPAERQNAIIANSMHRHMPDLLARRTGRSPARIAEDVRLIEKFVREKSRDK